MIDLQELLEYRKKKKFIDVITSDDFFANYKKQDFILDYLKGKNYEKK